MSAANGAEDFYSVEDHGARFEGLELARERDRRAMEAWGEHPYIDVVDNRADFETKVRIQWVRPNWVRVKAVSKFQHQLKYLAFYYIKSKVY